MFIMFKTSSAFAKFVTTLAGLATLLAVVVFLFLATLGVDSHFPGGYVYTPRH
jgi:hypothetical protein